jgi:hypothetical protein
MYQAIATKYFGPGNVRGSRVKASCDAKSIWHEWDSALNPDGNHIAAAQKLASSLEWNGVWNGGCMANGYVFVMTARDSRDGFVVAAKGDLPRE